MSSTLEQLGPIDVHAGSSLPVVSQFKYDALEAKGKRKAAPPRVLREDTILPTRKRSRLASNTQDLCRNFAIASWMLRRHLDYVTQFEFHSRTGNDDLDNQIEQLMAEDSRPVNMDRGRRFDRERYFRSMEAASVIHGDVGNHLFSDGRIKGVESDLIRNPEGKTAEDGWVNGIKVNGDGAALAYGLHRRTRSGRGYEFIREVPAKYFLHHGFFDRFATDQTRGVSPLVAALNPLRDVYENFDYALAKAKVTQLFAIAFYRAADDSPGQLSGGINADGEEDKAGYDVDFGRGPLNLDLDDGDRAEFLESKHPSTEFQQFTQLMIMVGLKSLDLPYSFYDEKHTNFFGSRAAWLHYERSCKHKRDNQIETRRKWTIFKYRDWIIKERLTLPGDMTVADAAFEWVPKGMPWWDPAKEIRGDLAAIGAGLDNPQRIVKERGRGDFKDNVDKLIEAKKYARDQGMKELGEPLILNFDMQPDIEIKTNDNADD